MPLLCRDPASFRACLTYFSYIQSDAILDLSLLQFVDPGALVLLRHTMTAMDKPATVIVPTREGPRSYVEDLIAKGIKPKNPNKYPLRFVEKEQDLAKDLGVWRKMLLESEALDEERARNFSSNMSEVLTNSFTHGKTKFPCIVAGQTFRKEHHSVLAAVDHGLTIPGTLKASKRYDGERSDEEWILLSLQEGVTCGSRQTNRGIGLYYLSKMVKQNHGSMLLASGNGLVFIDSDGTTKAQPLGKKYNTFQGTFLILDINTET